jgi:hypothetical protein
MTLLEAHPELGLLMVAVPLRIAELADVPEARRLALARESGQDLAEHGDDLMFRTKGRTAKAFASLATGLAVAAYQPGGVTFATMHFCTDHAACRAAETSTP